MASVNFLYRSTKEESILVLRLLHRDSNKISIVINKKTGETKEYPFTDYIF
jgi:hypothetical protein